MEIIRCPFNTVGTQSMGKFIAVFFRRIASAIIDRISDQWGWTEETTLESRSAHAHFVIECLKFTALFVAFFANISSTWDRDKSSILANKTFLAVWEWPTCALIESTASFTETS